MSTSLSQSLTGAPSPSEAKGWRFTPLSLPDVLLIEAPRFGDARGWFSETYNERVFAQSGVDLNFVQDNMSFSATAGTVRGLHYQSEPFAQDKLVRVLKGSILDVAVDIRKRSATFGRHVSALLSAENGRALLVPAGFAHGFITREPDTLVAYKVTALYAPAHDHGIFWADPELDIDWGAATETEATLSAKDRVLPLLKDAQPLFV
jgi:dTDP-4-dehydrorhamnose 3,5-epimerase